MTTEHDTPAAPPEEGAAALDDFSHLAAEAAALEGGPPVPGTPEADKADALTLAMQIEGNAELVEFGWQIVGPWVVDRYAQQYGPAQRAKIAEAYTKLAIKRGWDLGDLFAKWGPEIALVAAIAAPALPVFMADMKRRKEGGADVSDSEATH